MNEVRMACINENELQDECKRKNMVIEWKEGRLDVLGVGETHIIGKGVVNGCVNEGLWEGMEGMVIWSGLNEEYKGRAKEGVAFLLSP